jgi:UDP-glucose 4-epimerase
MFITGGMGLIGHNIVRMLEKTHFHNITITDTKTNYGFIPQAEIDYLMNERQKRIQTMPHDVDVRNHEHLDYLFDKTKPDVVYHLASYPRQKAVEANPVLASDVMNTGLTNLLELSVKHGVKRFIYVSSSMVYGDFEHDVTEDSLCNPIGQYGIFKLMGEHLVKDYARRGHFDYTILRPSAVYGPLDVEDRVVSKFMLTAMRGGVLRVNGSSETLDFTYVDDAADGVVSAALVPAAANQTFNITKSHSVSLLEAARMIIEIVGKGSIELRDKDADFPSRGALNIDRARAVLGYNPQVDVEEGFENYYGWFKNSLYWAPKTV